MNGNPLELLKEIKPKVVRVAILRNPTIPTHAVLWQETERAGSKMDLRLARWICRRLRLRETFILVAKSRSEALVLLPEPTTLAPEKSSRRALPRLACRRCTRFRNMSNQGASLRTVPAVSTYGGGAQATSIKFSKEENPPTCD